MLALLKLLEQVSAKEPYRHEPYMHGLEIAQRLGDDDGIRWACLGILKQAWPNNRKEIEDSAHFASAALMEKLRKDGKTADAAQFKKDLDEAQQRDCMVKITWTGNADVDLLVQEPSGAVCSFHNVRTSGGGVLLGDTYTKTGSTPTDGYSESYVLPEGFNGEYKLLLRRVWGQVATGKVTVDIFTHYGTPKQTHIRQQIPVSEQDAVVTFALADGRRKEPLEQAQVAQAIADQSAISNAVLAQQASLLDVAAAAAAADATNAGNGLGNGTGTGVNPFFPFTLKGAVGYVVVPTILPEGTYLPAFAVVSADRRYVRILSQPQFTSIPAVTTFNTATGSTGGGGGIN